MTQERLFIGDLALRGKRGADEDYMGGLVVQL